MESANELELHERVTELVNDEENIVTIESLMNEFKISKNKALQLLQGVVCRYKDGKLGSLYVTYLLYGSLKNGKGISLSLVKEEDLDSRKCLFDDISSETIYSVQKGKNLEVKMIALTNSACGKRYNLVSKNSVKRNIKTKRLPVVQTDSKNKQNVASTISSSSGSKESSKTNGATNAKPQSSQQNKSKQGGLANFFAQATTKPKSNNKVEEKTGNINDGTEKSLEKEESPNKKKDTDIENKVTIKEKNEDKQSQNTQMEKSVKDDQVNPKKRKKENKSKGPNKKRKRIQQICDSDSDDIFDDNEHEDIIDLSEEETPSSAPVTKSVPVPKNKKRKAVDKTYEDEEGFIVTTTEYIYETASDEDKEPVKQKKVEVLSEKRNEKVKSPPAEAKPVKGKGKGNKKAPVSGKQPTLMSFFKKS